MAKGEIEVRLHDLDAETWDTLAKAFTVRSSNTTTWVEVRDRDTNIRLVFFKAHGPAAEWDEDDAHDPGCATQGSSASECTCGKADALAEASA